MYEPFLGRIEIIRVRVWRRRRENDEEEKKKKEKCSEKWENPDLFSFYEAFEPGRFKTDPFSFICGR